MLARDIRVRIWDMGIGCRASIWALALLSTVGLVVGSTGFEVPTSAFVYFWLLATLHFRVRVQSFLASGPIMGQAFLGLPLLSQGLLYRVTLEFFLMFLGMGRVELAADRGYQAMCIYNEDKVGAGEQALRRTVPTST